MKTTTTMKKSPKPQARRRPAGRPHRSGDDTPERAIELIGPFSLRTLLLAERLQGVLDDVIALDNEAADGHGPGCDFGLEEFTKSIDAALGTLWKHAQDLALAQRCWRQDLAREAREEREAAGGPAPSLPADDWPRGYTLPAGGRDDPPQTVKEARMRIMVAGISNAEAIVARVKRWQRVGKVGPGEAALAAAVWAEALRLHMKAYRRAH